MEVPGEPQAFLGDRQPGMHLGITLQHALTGQGIPVLSILGLQLGGFVVLAALAGALTAVTSSGSLEGVLFW